MKTIYVDTETVGVDKNKHAIIQLGAVIETELNIEEVNVKMRPHEDSPICPTALKVNNRTIAEIEAWPSPAEAYTEFTKKLRCHVNPFDSADKFIWIGYNAMFDMDFVREWFMRQGNVYFGSWFFFPPIDVMTLAAYVLRDERDTMGKFRQSDVAEHLGIDASGFRLHDALEDVKLMMAIYRELQKRLGGTGDRQKDSTQN